MLSDERDSLQKQLNYDPGNEYIKQRLLNVSEKLQSRLLLIGQKAQNEKNQLQLQLQNGHESKSKLSMINNKINELDNISETVKKGAIAIGSAALALGMAYTAYKTHIVPAAKCVGDLCKRKLKKKIPVTPVTPHSGASNSNGNGSEYIPPRGGSMASSFEWSFGKLKSEFIYLSKLR